MTPRCLAATASVMDGTPGHNGAGVYIVLLVIEDIIDLAIVQRIHNKKYFKRSSID
jgi:hypothetical protein